MPAFIFDLDGTLIDSVYAHVLAWQQALAESGIAVDGWRINRRIGMSGDLLMHALGDELQVDRRRNSERRSNSDTPRCLDRSVPTAGHCEDRDRSSRACVRPAFRLELRRREPGLGSTHCFSHLKLLTMSWLSKVTERNIPSPSRMRF
jgi:phosphoglycolate phosphatase-like HAD superfamily hydrolase